MRAIGRLFAVSIGYILAVIAAGIFLLAARVGIEPQNTETAGLFWGQFVIYGGVAASFIGAAAFVPWVVFAFVSEIFSLRSFVIHVGAGGLIGLAAAIKSAGWVITTAEGTTQLGTPESTMMVAAGFVGGFVYWLVAGRMAGLGRRGVDEAPTA